MNHHRQDAEPPGKNSLCDFASLRFNLLLNASAVYKNRCHSFVKICAICGSKTEVCLLFTAKTPSRQEKNGLCDFASLRFNLLLNASAVYKQPCHPFVKIGVSVVKEDSSFVVTIKSIFLGQS